MVALINKPVTFTRSGKTAPNVFLKSAMTERLGSWSETDLGARGKPTAAYLRLYTEWGQGAIGTIVLGNIPCDRTHPEAVRNVVMDPLSADAWDAVEAFRPAISAAKAHGSLVIGQVTHGGRQTPVAVNPHPLSSSDVGLPPTAGKTSYGQPRPMTVEEIKDVAQRFAYAAKTLHTAGADGIQLHAAHGYLLSQFLSPRVNKRTDEYGGETLDGRSRIVFEVIQAIKDAVPDTSFIIAIKINSADFAEGGFEAEDSREMAFRLEAAGVDLIELSGGTYESPAWSGAQAEVKTDSTRNREAFFLEFAERIRPHLTSAKLCVTGGFRTLDGMEQALSGGATDLIGMARPLTAEPRLCAALLSGASTAAKPFRLALPAQSGASILHLSQLGAGVPPSDVADEATAEKIQAVMKSDGFGPAFGRNEVLTAEDIEKLFASV